MNNENTKNIVGNDMLVNQQEELLVEYLRKNLEQTNKISKPVLPKKSLYLSVVKRGLDLAIATPVFLICMPLNAVFALCTYFDVGRPILFKQTRVGKNNKKFTIVKFRNMNNDVDIDGNLLPAKDRVTKFGKFMRRYSLDELLNLLSVIKGDMSIIGPRPLPVTFVDRMSERHKMRSLVKPGLECPRSVNRDPQISQYEKQFEKDIWYVENVSFITDVRQLFLLIKMALNSEYRSNTAVGASYFVGYDENCKATSYKKYCKEHPDVIDKLI